MFDICIACNNDIQFQKDIVSKIDEIPEGLDRSNNVKVKIYSCKVCKSIKIKNNQKLIPLNVSYQQSVNKNNRIDNNMYSNDEFLFLKNYLKENDSILDYGCGGGFLLNKFSNKGFNIEGIDIDKESINYIKKNHNYKVILGDYKDLKKKYNLIILFGVFEHIDEPKLFLKKIMSHLKFGGHIFIAIPNPHSLNAIISNLSKHKWDMLLEPGHLNIFTKQGMIKLIEKDYDLVKYSTSTITIRGKVPVLPHRITSIEKLIVKIITKYKFLKTIYILILKLIDFFYLGDISYYLIKKNEKENSYYK